MPSCSRTVVEGASNDCGTGSSALTLQPPVSLPARHVGPQIGAVVARVAGGG